MSRVLTIGIPTYNRSELLERMLSELIAAIGEFSESVEVIISNNCSKDDTEGVIARFCRDAPAGLSVKHQRHDRNIGPSKNIISLFYMASTPYFMYLADDDTLYKDGFIRILKVLNSDSSPSAVLCANLFGKLHGHKFGFTSYRDASSLFYEYGNSWSAIVDPKAAIEAVESRDLRGAAEATVWAQTVYGYLAMYDSRSKPIYIANFEYGGSLTGQWETVSNKFYWVTSLYGLLVSAVLIDRAVGENWIKRDFFRLRVPGFYKHVKAIFWYALIADSHACTLELRNILKREFGVLGFIWSQIFKLSDNKIAVQRVYQWGFMVSRLESKKKFMDKLSFARDQYILQVDQAVEQKKRYGDWF